MPPQISIKVVPSDKSGPFGFLKSGHLNFWDSVLFVPPSDFSIHLYTITRLIESHPLPGDSRRDCAKTNCLGTGVHY